MNEESLFHEARARADLRDRAAFLDSVCADRPDLRSAVEALLAVHDSSNDFLAAPAVADWSVDTNARAGSTDRNSNPSESPTVDAAAATAPAGPPTPPADLPDHIGRYAVREILGHGGMGTVYLAHDPELDRLVALKVPKLGGRAAEERFLQEARAAAAVTHPNLCPVFDAGRADGVLYLAMAYVPGTTLGKLLADDGPMPPAKAAALAVGVALGMAEAHRHAIVHRDLKPGNVLLDRRGEPVVTDFGLARRDAVPDVAAETNATSAQDPRLTQAGAIMGTPAYMSPEQARGDLDQVGPASDVYALGAILFEMLTGRVPFQGDTIPETLRRIATNPVPPVPGVPAGLEAVCRRALARDPAARPPSMEAFAASLAPFAAPRRRSRWVHAVAAAAAGVLLLAAGTILYIKTDHGTVEVRLNDPKADVQVSVDGNTVTLTDTGGVTKLRAGPHGLEVKGPGFETETRLFKVTRGETTVVEVALKPKGVPGPGPDPVGPGGLTPDQAKLAGLLIRGEQLVDKTRLRELEGLVDEALKLDPASPGALGLRAHIRQKQGDVVRAKADAEAALKLNPETPRALLVLSHLLADEDKLDECIAAETIVIRLWPNNVLGWMNRSKSYLDRKDFRQAIADATRAIAAGPGTVSAVLNRGSAYALLGEYDKALADYDAAVRIAENDPRVYDQRAMVHARLGNKDKAEADWKKAEDIDPALKGDTRGSLLPPQKVPERKKLTPAEAQAVAAALQAAQTAWDRGRIPEAQAATDGAYKTDPTSGVVRAWRARLMAQGGRFEDAIAEATEAIRRDPTLGWAYVTRGAGRINRDDPAAGIADLTIALTMDPAAWAAWYNRGLAYMARGQFQQALADYDEALGLNPKMGEAHANRGVCHLSLGEYEKARAEYARAADLQPTVAQWRWVGSSIEAKLGNLEAANRLKAEAVRLNGNVPPPDISLPTPLPPVKRDPVLPTTVPTTVDRDRLAKLLERGRRLLDEVGQLDKLAKVADEAVAVDPESPGALALRALARALDGDVVGARADADHALRLNPETRPALIARGIANGEDGKFNDAIADETAAIRLDPKYARSWANRSKSYLDREDYHQAIADATRAIELKQGGPDALFNRAGAFACLGDYPKALADFDAAAKVAENDWRVYDQRSALHSRMGNAKLEAADWAMAKKLNPDLKIEQRVVFADPPKPPERKKLTPAESEALKAALAAGQKAWVEDRFADCLKAAEVACQIDLSSAPARSLRARVWGQLGRDPEAAAEATEAIRLDPTDADAYTNRGVARVKQKDFAGAIADHTIALWHAPTNPLVWNNRGYAYFRREQFHQAVADLTEAIRLRPNYVNALANRGSCYLSLGDYEKALADYDAAAKLQPLVGRWRMIGSVVKARLGDSAGADRDRAEAIRLEPGLQDAKPLTLPTPPSPVKKDPE